VLYSSILSRMQLRFLMCWKCFSFHIHPNSITLFKDNISMFTIFVNFKYILFILFIYIVILIGYKLKIAIILDIHNEYYSLC